MHAFFPVDAFHGSSRFWQFHQPYIFEHSGCGGESGDSIALKNLMGIQFSRSLPIMEWKKHWSFWLMSFTETWIRGVCPTGSVGYLCKIPWYAIERSCFAVVQLLPEFTVAGEQLSRSCSSAGWLMVQGFLFCYLLLLKLIKITRGITIKFVLHIF